MLKVGANKKCNNQSHFHVVVGFRSIARSVQTLYMNLEKLMAQKVCYDTTVTHLSELKDVKNVFRFITKDFSCFAEFFPVRGFYTCFSDVFYETHRELSEAIEMNFERVRLLEDGLSLSDIVASNVSFDSPETYPKILGNKH